MIAGMILAAGESSRMNRDKALLLYRGRTFLETIVLTLRETGIQRIAVVLGHHAEEIRRSVKLDEVDFVFNPEWRHGQTSSLQAGLRTLGSPDLDAIVLALVDHPAVSPETVRALVTSFHETHAPVVIPVQHLQRGHPVVIARTLFPQLMSLGPDAGANLIIRKYRDQTQFLEVDDPGVLQDVDDPETFRQLEID